LAVEKGNVLDALDMFCRAGFEEAHEVLVRIEIRVDKSEVIVEGETMSRCLRVHLPKDGVSALLLMHDYYACESRLYITANESRLVQLSIRRRSPWEGAE
jgi:hypothetical protein